MADREYVLRTITARDLIAELSAYDPEALVVFQYPANDYVGRQLAGEIRGVYPESIWWCEQHRAWQVGDDEKTCPDYLTPISILLLD